MRQDSSGSLSASEQSPTVIEYRLGGREREHLPDSPDRKTSPLSKHLNLAELWAKEWGMEVVRSEFEPRPGERAALLQMDPKLLSFFVRDEGKRVCVFAMADIPSELRRSLEGSRSDELEFLTRLQQDLTVNPRLGFIFLTSDGVPAKTLQLSEVQRIAVEQYVRISEADLSSYNRYWDAIQEVRTAMFRVARLFGLLSSGAGTQTYSSSTPPPPDLYR